MQPRFLGLPFNLGRRDLVIGGGGTQAERRERRGTTTNMEPKARAASRRGRKGIPQRNNRPIAAMTCWGSKVVVMVNKLRQKFDTKMQQQKHTDAGSRISVFDKERNSGCETNGMRK